MSDAAEVITIACPVDSLLIELDVAEGQAVAAGDRLAILESMKVQTMINSDRAGIVSAILATAGDTLQRGQPICRIAVATSAKRPGEGRETAFSGDADALAHFRQRAALTLDAARAEAVASRHARGLRTARENLADLFDDGSFTEYGQFAVAAQRGRKEYAELQARTPADGVITGIGTVNSALFGDARSGVAAAVNDFTVLAGTQGYFHHKKLERIMAVARQRRLPLVMYTEGGGGRPGDTDAQVQNSWQDMTTVTDWGRLHGVVPRIAVNNGFCFAGNAALFGGADIRIATRQSWIGMAGPAMIEGGGLGRHEATAIGPAELQAGIGGIDMLAADEREATAMARKILGYFQGALADWDCPDQERLWQMMPADRRVTYDVRKLIGVLADGDSFVELQREHARTIITGLVRIEGQPLGLLANDCRVLGGAIDTQGAAKAAGFVAICDNFGIPLLSLCDTPGFMVGPESEAQGAVREMSRMLTAIARVNVPLVTIFLRRGYGMGAMAMAGGSFRKPVFAAAWPGGEFGGMGIEAAVRLGFRKELEAAADEDERNALFDRLVRQAYEQGKAVETAAYLEIDAVIEPRDTRRKVVSAIFS